MQQGDGSYLEPTRYLPTQGAFYHEPTPVGVRPSNGVALYDQADDGYLAVDDEPGYHLASAPKHGASPYYSQGNINDSDDAGPMYSQAKGGSTASPYYSQGNINDSDDAGPMYSQAKGGSAASPYYSQGNNNDADGGQVLYYMARTPGSQPTYDRADAASPQYAELKKKTKRKQATVTLPPVYDTATDRPAAGAPTYDLANNDTAFGFEYDTATGTGTHDYAMASASASPTYDNPVTYAIPMDLPGAVYDRASESDHQATYDLADQS